jgi:iron complex outermembrane receptor protein
MQGILAMMFDNERVEVLRGPQGTLFGRNSTVGSINIISAKPQFGAFDGRIWAQFGNYNAPELQGMINVPVSDTVALRFAGRYFQRDSYIDGYWDPNQFDQRFVNDIVDNPAVIAPGSFDQCTSPECQTRTQHTNWWVDDTGDSIYALERADDSDFYMNAKEWAYRGSLRWQPKSMPVSLNVSFQHYRSDSSGGIDLVNCDKLRGRPTYELDADNQLVYEDGKPKVSGVNDCSTMFPNDDTYQAVVNTPGRFFLDIMYLRSQFNWDINKNLRLVFLAGGEDQDRESTQDMEQSLNAWDQYMSFLPGTGSRSWMGEVQLQSFGDKKFNWIAGANIFNEKTSTIGFFDNTIDEKSMWEQPNRSTDAWALFGQGTYSFTPRWHLTLGYRYSDETKEDQGGKTYLCNPRNGCAPELGRQRIEFETRFDREDLGTKPTDFFANSAEWSSLVGCPSGDPNECDNINANDNKGSWSHHDWRIGLDYQLENTLLYSYLATGFKAGGIGDVFEGTVVDGDIDENGRPFVVSAEEITVRTEYDPEEVVTLELGAKQRFLNGKLNVKGAYFFSDYENMQYASVGSLAFTERYGLVLDPNGDPVDENGDGRPDRAWQAQPMIVAYFTQNVPGAEIQGFEFEYDWLPWTGGRIWGYASWLDTEITEDWITKWDYDPVSYFAIDYANSVDASNELLQVNLKGNSLAVSPPFKLHTTIEHTFVMPKLGISPWATIHWEDASYLTIWNVDQHGNGGQPCPEQGPNDVPDGCVDFVILPQDLQYTDDRREPWSMLHAGLRFYHGKSTTELFAYNLTNEVVQWWGGAAEQVPKGSMSMPRTFGIRYQYRF